MTVKTLSFRRYLLILGTAFVAMLAVVWSVTVNERMYFLDTDYPQWNAKLDMLVRCDVGDVTVLGDSRAVAGYVPRVLGTNIRNLALTGATPLETFYEAKRIVGCPHPPKVIILSFSPRQYGHIEWLWLHAVSYNLLKFKDLQEIAAVEHMYGRSVLYGGAFGSEPPPAMKNWMYAHHFPPYDFASLLAAAKSERFEINKRFYAETLANGGQHTQGIPARCTYGPAWEANQTRFAASPLLTFYLRRMLTLFNSNGIHVIFGPTPISVASGRVMPLSYAKDFEAYIEREARYHTDVVVTKPLMPIMKDCAFGDAHHLNEKGALAFSSGYAPILRETLNNF